MLTSLRLFLKKIAQRWWLWAVGVPSGVFTVYDMYLPQSSGLLASVRSALPEVAITIFIGALLVATFQTFHDLRAATAKDYDPAIGKRFHDLYQRGHDLAHGRGPFLRKIKAGDLQEWVNEVESLLREHMPGELRMFQTIGDDQNFGLLPLRYRRIEHPRELRPKVDKLRLIMGRYEARQ